jgi:phage shock protein C
MARYRPGWSHGGVPETDWRDGMEYFRQQGLVRPRQGRVIAGVCAGLANRFGISPFAARLLFVFALLILPGSQIIVYPILWILMPSE